MEQQNQQLTDYTAGAPCLNFYIHHLSPENVLSGSHRHDFFQIILVERGTARQQIDFGEHTLGEKSVSVVFPHQIHRLEPDADCRITIVMFDQTIFCLEMLRNELKDYNIDLQRKINYLSLKEHPGVFDEMMEFVGKIERLYADLNSVRKMQVKLMIKILLLKIIDFFPDSERLAQNDTDTSIYIRFREKVDAEFREQRKVQQYAGQMGISVKKLTAVARHYSGQSPLEIIHEKLSLELKKALALDDMTFKEIAFQFGFSSQSALNKYIEQKFGQTPLALKNRLKEGMNGKKSGSVSNL